jgi:hypothetical protein
MPEATNSKGIVLGATVVTRSSNKDEPRQSHTTHGRHVCVHLSSNGGDIVMDRLRRISAGRLFAQL